MGPFKKSTRVLYRVTEPNWDYRRPIPEPPGLRDSVEEAVRRQVEVQVKNQCWPFRVYENEPE